MAPHNTESVNTTPPSADTSFQLEDHPIDVVPKSKAIVVGAGIAGVTAAALLLAKVPNLELAVYEKNPKVGGVWYENIYPDVKADVPAPAYQSTFDPNTQWTQFYAPGEEVRQYWEDIAKRHNVYDVLHFNTKAIDAEFDNDTGLWTIEFENVKTGEKSKDTANFFISALGQFNTPRYPDYPGLDEFEGPVIHSYKWDYSVDPKGKKVALIGNGNSGIQITQYLQTNAEHLDLYARNPAWIAYTFGGEVPPDPIQYSSEQLSEFKNDPEKYLEYRKSVENGFHRLYDVSIKDSELNNAVRQGFEQNFKEHLGDKYDELIDVLRPKFPVACRLLSPGLSYLDSIIKDNVEYIPNKIKRFTPKGIETEDGKFREVDIIYAATGADNSFVPTFPIKANGINLQKAWSKGNSPGYAETYLGVTVANFPNFFLINGPNAWGWGGTVPYSIEAGSTYIAKLIRKAVFQRIKYFSPVQEAVDDFTAYRNAYFPKTVFGEDCNSWFKNDEKLGPILGLWPGSFLHSIVALNDPRYEDFTYTYQSKSGNRFAWFGSGYTQREKNPDTDLTNYLRTPDKIDLATVHESWVPLYKY